MAASGYRFAIIRAKIIESARRCNGNSDDCAMNALCLSRRHAFLALL
jgi:hypothetical protein